MSDGAAVLRKEAEPVLEPGQSDASLTDKVSDIVLTRPVGRAWLIGLVVSALFVLLFMVSIAYLFAAGIGIWGVNIPVAWGYAIANYVWWIGIGNAGTLISSMLFLTRQRWRTSINRFAEAMTIFAAAIAGLFPILHLGRYYLFYWLVPYPDIMGVWPQWNSPLVWDFFAIAIYILVSLLFWYLGMVPDLATLRDRAQTLTKRRIYGALALGWRGSALHWRRYERAYLLLAALAVPLVVSVHSVVGMDFAAGIVPGWHETLFPPYFVIGAMFSGFAMVMDITIILRAAFGLHDFITLRHLENMAKILLAASLIMGYAYGMEIFIAWYSADQYDWLAAVNQMRGAYAWAYWTFIACNVLVPQLFWLRRVRTNVPLLFVIAIVINIGMWLERFVIVVNSLHRDFLPSSWGMFYPTIWDWTTLIGSLGLFIFLFFLFARFVPMISMHEMRKLVRQMQR